MVIDRRQSPEYLNLLAAPIALFNETLTVNATVKELDFSG
jgi:hypothetical protein